MSGLGDGVIAVGARVSFLMADSAFGPRPVGERPRVRMWQPGDPGTACRRRLNATDSRRTITYRCTREAGHPGVHVEHESPNMPLAAWEYEDPRT